MGGEAGSWKAGMLPTGKWAWGDTSVIISKKGHPEKLDS